MRILLVFYKPAALFRAGLAQHAEHVLLVGLHARLVEGIDPGHVAGDRAGQLEEADQGGKALFVALLDLDHEARHAALDVRGLAKRNSRTGSVREFFCCRRLLITKRSLFACVCAIFCACLFLPCMLVYICDAIKYRQIQGMCFCFW